MAFFSSRGMTPFQRMSEEKKNELYDKWGNETVTKMLTGAQELFFELDKCKGGMLDLKEFSTLINLMGADGSPLAGMLFNALDLNQDGKLSFYEFFHWMLVMMYGALDDKLTLGYRLLDLNHDNRVTKLEMVETLNVLFGVLTSLKIKPPQLEDYVDMLWEKMNLSGEEGISLEDYQKAAQENNAFIKSFGSVNGCQYQPMLIKTAGVQLFFGQQKFDAMLSVMCSLQLSMDGLAEEDPLDMTEFNDSDFASLRLVDRFDLPAKDNTKVQVNSYYPQLFRDIRRLSGIDERAFVNSVGLKQVVGSLLLGDLTTMSGLVSLGKSNSYFFYSYNGHFLIKTVTMNEYYTLRNMAVPYYKHLRAYPRSLLTRYYGLFKLKDVTTVFFVVLGNAFTSPLPMDLSFDLKGSTLGRSAFSDTVVDFTRDDVIYKDLDWMASDRHLNLGPIKTPLVWEQIQRDSDFLQLHNIIDYSLLVGIRHRPNYTQSNYEDFIQDNMAPLGRVYSNMTSCFGDEARPDLHLLNFDDFCWASFVQWRRKQTESEEGQPILKAEFGELPCYQVNQQERLEIGDDIVYLSIIDTLISYGTFKQSEHVLKSVVHRKREVSVIPPADYRTRFLRFVRKEVLVGLPPCEAPDAEWDDGILVQLASNAKRSAQIARASTSSLPIPDIAIDGHPRSQ